MFSYKPKKINLFPNNFHFYLFCCHIIVELGNRLDFIEKVQQKNYTAIGMLTWDFDLADLKGFDTNKLMFFPHICEIFAFLDKQVILFFC